MSKAKLELCLEDGIFTSVGNEGTITSITAGTGLKTGNSASGGTITTSGTISLADTSVQAGTVSYPESITFNQQGQAVNVVGGKAPIRIINGTPDQIIVTVDPSNTVVISLANDVTIAGKFTSETLQTAGNAIIGGTGAIRIPSGTITQRPISPKVGDMRILLDS